MDYLNFKRKLFDIDGIKELSEIVLFCKSSGVISFNLADIDNIRVHFIKYLAELYSIRQLLKIIDVGLNKKALTLVMLLAHEMS